MRSVENTLDSRARWTASPARTAAPTVEAVTDPDRAAALAEPWQALSERALDRNPFFEPWLLLPALGTYGEGDSVVLAVVRDGNAPSDDIIGIFPLVRRARLGPLPLPHLAVWNHPQNFLGTPLVSRQAPQRAWAALRTWAAQQGAAPLDMSWLTSDCKTLQAAGTRPVVVDRFERTALVPDHAGAEAYRRAASSSGSRKTWRRLRRRLSERGQLELRRLEPTDAPDPWIEAFLEMEAAGWKGREGTALGSSPAGAAFFRGMARAAHERGRLHLIGLFLDDQSVAMQCNILAGDRAFAFKVAYDEAFHPFSPGVLLELDAIDDFHRMPGLTHVDSCTGASHNLMPRLWKETQTVERVLVPVSGALGRITARALGASLALRERTRAQE